MKPKLVIILGPTGVGKSEVAFQIALNVNGEIINADSQQVYRYMNIGTAKPALEKRKRVPHHLIDIMDPDEEFNAALFRQMALRIAQEIWSRGKEAIVCGGTGLYIKALLHGLFIGPPKDLAIRARLEKEIQKRGLGGLYERLKKNDSGAAGRIHPNDRQRIIRALEVFELTGRPMGEWQEEHGFKEDSFDAFKAGLNRNREELYSLIDRRCGDMIAHGFVEEVRALLERGYKPDLNSMKSVGYRHICLYLNREIDLESSLSFMKRDTRRLAKRQLTWFRADKQVRWFHPENDRDELIEAVKRFLSQPHPES